MEGLAFIRGDLMRNPNKPSKPKRGAPGPAGAGAGGRTAKRRPLESGEGGAGAAPRQRSSKVGVEAWKAFMSWEGLRVWAALAALPLFVRGARGCTGNLPPVLARVLRRTQSSEVRAGHST
jgi:hypothetical protein